MLLFITFLVAILIGILILYITRNNCNAEVLEAIGIGLIIIGIAGILTCGTTIIIANVNPELEYTKDYMQYEALNNAIQNGSVSGTTLLDAIRYNKIVMSRKKYYNNIWIGSFYYSGCENLPLINLVGN